MVTRLKIHLNKPLMTLSPRMVKHLYVCVFPDTNESVQVTLTRTKSTWNRMKLNQFYRRRPPYEMSAILCFKRFHFLSEFVYMFFLQQAVSFIFQCSRTTKASQNVNEKVLKTHQIALDKLSFQFWLLSGTILS